MQTTAFASAFAGSVAAFQPATQQRQGRQQLRVSAKDSRIGKVPITVPAKVDVKVNGQTVVVKVRGAPRVCKVVAWWAAGRAATSASGGKRPCGGSSQAAQPAPQLHSRMAVCCFGAGPQGRAAAHFPSAREDSAGAMGHGLDCRQGRQGRTHHTCMRAGRCSCLAWLVQLVAKGAAGVGRRKSTRQQAEELEAAGSRAARLSSRHCTILQL